MIRSCRLMWEALKFFHLKEREKMKKYLFSALVILLLLSLAACGAREERRTKQIEVEGQTLTITFDEGNRSAGVITAANGDYAFSYDTSGALTIVYPDGSVCTAQDMNGAVAFPADYDASERTDAGYIDAFSLWFVLQGAMSDPQRTQSGASLPLAFLLLGLGVWALAAPRSLWWLSSGWRYRNAEPSDLALGLYRGLGAAFLIGGIICALASMG